MKKPQIWTWVLCALWISAIAQADSQKDEASNDDARCACASSCSSKQECEESDCSCALKEILPTDPNPLTLSDTPGAWTYQDPSRAAQDPQE